MQLHRDPPGFAVQGSSASTLPPSFPLATHQPPRQKEADWALKGGKNAAILWSLVYILPKAPGRQRAGMRSVVLSAFLCPSQVLPKGLSAGLEGS